MALNKHTHGGFTFYSITVSHLNPKTKKTQPVGVAFRTATAPVGYLSFYDAKDANMDGEVSIGESIASYIPIYGNFTSKVWVVAGALDNNQFIDPGAPLDNIMREVQMDAINAGLKVGKGIFVDSVVMVMGGPAISKAVTAAGVKGAAGFILSQSIEYQVAEYIKKQGGVNTNTSK